ncbi:MAG TPA: thioredoxin family protein [Acidimicrobiales bacterium]|nr:thioredoxin family protein [Acidimicrobiales bacterium]
MTVDRLALAIVLIAVAAAAAWWLRRRQPQPPTQSHYQVPLQLDRDDFDGPAAPWLVVVFSSTVCSTCAEATAKAAVLAGPDVVVQDVSYQDRRDLHKRYNIEAAPTTVVADCDGVVRAAFVGAPSATDLWAAVAEARDPGSTPEPGLGAPT